MSFDPGELSAADPKKLSAEEFGELLAAAVRADAAGGADGGLQAVDSRVLARLVSRASNDQLNAVMGSGLREPVLAEIFARMGQQVRQDRTGGKTLVIRWRIGDRPDGGTDEYQSVISDGAYRTEHPPEREPAGYRLDRARPTWGSETHPPGQAVTACAPRPPSSTRPPGSCWRSAAC